MEAVSSRLYEYKGSLKEEFISDALEAYNQYKADKESIIARIRDNERLYNSWFMRRSAVLQKEPLDETPFIFSAIENAVADASENYPSPNILERSGAGSAAAEKLSKIIPVCLEMNSFKKKWKEIIRSKLKHGTGIFGVFYNEQKGEIDIRRCNILDVYCDVHLEDIQDSPFFFCVSAIDNTLLKETYPEFKALFCGDAQVEQLTDSYKIKNRSEVIDCYYKKTDGTLHLVKFCKNTVIMATEDMEDYKETGLYDHGMYPFIFDNLYPKENCPFGYGMIDIAKPTQTVIDKLGMAITRNIMQTSAVRYFSKQNGGVNENEFKNLEKQIVHYEGDSDGIKIIQGTPLNQYATAYRETKKDELKELLSNRDFQQGSTSGGVTAASAIETLQQAGEKRSRSMIDDTYATYKKIVYMVIELLRQFHNDKKEYRSDDEYGQKSFIEFCSSELYEEGETTERFNEETGEYERHTDFTALQFDIDVVPQRENPYTKESANNTILTFWGSGMFNPETYEQAIMALKNMNFDGKEKLIADMQEAMQSYQQVQPQMQPQAQQIIPAELGAEDMMQQAQAQDMAQGGEELIPMDITGGA